MPTQKLRYLGRLEYLFQETGFTLNVRDRLFLRA